jgi:hypothetical protein
VSVGNRLQIRLDLDPGSDPIRGQVQDSHGERFGFVGWLQLIAAVEERRSAALEPSLARESDPERNDQ